MAIQDSRVAARFTRAYCDVCQTEFPLCDMPLPFKGVLSVRKEWMDMSEIVLSPPFDRQSMRELVLAAHWKFEVFHGTEFLLCPKCQKK
jgi:hypothetical protein